MLFRNPKAFKKKHEAASVHIARLPHALHLCSLEKACAEIWFEARSGRRRGSKRSPAVTTRLCEPWDTWRGTSASVWMPSHSNIAATALAAFVTLQVCASSPAASRRRCAGDPARLRRSCVRFCLVAAATARATASCRSYTKTSTISGDMCGNFVWTV